MQPQETERRIVRFGSFEADLREARLSKGGIRIRLQEQPFQILVLLLERPGQVVTREEIRQKLWSNDTFVEFDDALNTAVRKLRAALSDSADNPRFLETVPRKGYRFLAPISLPELQGDQSPAQSKVPATPAPPSEVPQSNASRQLRIALQRRAWIGIAALMLATIAGIYWYRSRIQFQISSADTIVLADFVNTTGEAVFDDALRQALEIGLKQSPFVQVLSDRKVAVILKQMGRSPDAPMTGHTALDVCQRTGSKVTVQGSIASLGTTYLIGVAAIRCDNGEPVANEQIEAKRKEDVVDALGRASIQLRERLGESLPSIQKYNAPLEQATTPSLEALKAYGMALSTWDKKGDEASLPFFKKAIELDPNFAMAYGALATIYHNLGESALAKESTAKAYQLRDRVTESEKTTIESRYFMYVTGELEKAADAYEASVHNYPQSATPLNQLGSINGELGRYEQALENLRTALVLDPTRATTYANLAGDLLQLNRLEDADAVLAEAEKRKLQTDFLLQVRYWRAFLRADDAGMQQILVQSSDIPGAQALILTQQANTEAYHGRFEKAFELSGVAANLMQHDGDKESAATCLAEAAVREANVGRSAHARSLIAQAQKLSRGEDVVTLTAVVAAQVGDLQQADVLSRELDRESPSATFVQRYWLPVIRAQTHLDQRQWLKAVSDLDSAVQLEFAGPSALSVATIYPAYVRGYAYLSAGDGAKAAAEFQKLIDHSGIVLNFPLAPLARLGRARAYARSGDAAKARAAYLDFLQLWHDADPDLPILKQAKIEYAKLQSSPV
jgi:DNA-binding winged helix-turn-helix (wHTH) protein/tetratricopeptide (TPR) repeat protein